MTISARSVAVSGFGFGVLAIAVSGFISADQVPAPQQDNFGGRNYYRFAYEAAEKKRKAREVDAALIAKALPLKSDPVAEQLAELRQLLLNKPAAKEIVAEPKWGRIHGTIHVPKSGRLDRRLPPAIVADQIRDDGVGVLVDDAAVLRLPIVDTTAPVSVVTSSAPAAVEVAALNEDIEEYNLMMMLTIIAAHA